MRTPGDPRTTMSGPIKNKKLRRIRDRKRMKTLLELLVRGGGDSYETYRALYALWCSNNAAVPELKPLFRIPGIEPDGAISITEKFKKTVQSLAKEILPSVLGSKVDLE